MTILVGFTPTPPARAALAQAIELAQRRNEPLIVVNGSRELGRSDENRLSHDEHEELDERLVRAGIEFRVVTPHGEHEPAEQVLAAAAEHGADLIVIGIRKRSPVGKLFLGSSAQRILLEADCPVVSVKA